MTKVVVCGVRVEDIEEPTMQEIRYLDKLIDELLKEKLWRKFYGQNNYKRRNNVPFIWEPKDDMTWISRPPQKKS